MMSATKNPLDNLSLQRFSGVPSAILMGPDEKMTPRSNPSTERQPTSTTFHPSSVSEVTMGEGSLLSTSSKSKEKVMQVTVPCHLVPSNRKKITNEHSRDMWDYANHFSKDLPKVNPKQEHINKYCDILKEVHDFTHNTVNDCLLKHLQSLARKHGYTSDEGRGQTVTQITQIHNAVLKSSSEFSNEYLQRVLEFIKLPLKHKKQGAWLSEAVDIVKSQYDIQFPFNGKKNFVENVGDECFKDGHQLRLRRGMVTATGTVWYDRKPKQDHLGTLFGNAVTSQAYMEVWVGDVGPIRGYLVKKVGQEDSALSLRQLQPTVLGAKSEEVRRCVSFCTFASSSHAIRRVLHLSLSRQSEAVTQQRECQQ